MPDAPTPLDLDVIVAAIAECRTYSFGMYQADRLAHEHAPALVEEVNRLRAEVARLAPAWDEEAVVEGMARAVYPFLFTDGRQPLRVFGEARSDAELREGERDVARERMRQALAVVRDHQPVKPRREAVARALAEHRLMGGRCRCGLDPRLDYYRYEQHVTDAVLSLLPGRSEAVVKAEGLREARDEVRASSFWADGSDNYADRVRGYLSARADRLSAEGGADRG